jgi:ATP-binding protein involved in chromosome partitioning
MQENNLARICLRTSWAEVVDVEEAKWVSVWDGKIVSEGDFNEIWERFTPDKHPVEKYYIFGKGGGHKLAREFDTWLLGQIPLVMEVVEAAEQGLSVFSQKNREVVETFEKIAELPVSKVPA